MRMAQERTGHRQCSRSNRHCRDVARAAAARDSTYGATLNQRAPAPVGWLSMVPSALPRSEQLASFVSGIQGSHFSMSMFYWPLSPSFDADSCISRLSGTDRAD